MIIIENLSHRYRTRSDNAIDDINLNVNKGEILVILGSSGSGKSTLLKCINRLIEPDYGKIYIGGNNILNTSVSKTEELRRGMGMVFQQFNLIERNTVFENVITGRLGHTTTLKSILGIFSADDNNIVLNCLNRVTLHDYAYEQVRNLSGGQKQRTGIARALAQEPYIILADEPVSALDPKLMNEIMDLLQKICTEDGITLIVSLHFLELARKYATRIIGMNNGKIVFNGYPEELDEESIINIYGKSRDWRLRDNIGY